MSHNLRLKIEQHVIGPLFRDRPLWLLLLISLVLGAAYAITLLPLGLIGGTSAFWAFPAGSIPGSGNDMATGLVGYLYFVRSPWQLPLLHVATLGNAPGTNVFWLDVVPWASLLGKVVYSCSGIVVNPFGYFLFLCFALPGFAMTTAVAATGQRSLIATLAATGLGTTRPSRI